MGIDILLQKEKKDLRERILQMILTRWAVVFSGVVLISLAGGCQEQENGVDAVRRHRLISVENKQLKARIDKQDKKIESLKESLAKCQKDRDKWKETATKTVQKNVREILSLATEESAQLRKENAKLKAQIEQLKQESNAGQ